MILFIGGPVDWGVGAGMGDMDGRHWIPWERLRNSPELRVWTRIRSDDRQTNGQTEFPLQDSTPVSGRVKISLND